MWPLFYSLFATSSIISKCKCFAKALPMIYWTFKLPVTKHFCATPPLPRFKGGLPGTTLADDRAGCLATDAKLTSGYPVLTNGRESVMAVEWTEASTLFAAGDMGIDDRLRAASSEHARSTQEPRSSMEWDGLCPAAPFAAALITELEPPDVIAACILGWGFWAAGSFSVKFWGNNVGRCFGASVVEWRLMTLFFLDADDKLSVDRRGEKLVFTSFGPAS